MPGATELDPSLRRVQRDSAVIAIAAAALALAMQRGQPNGALGVLAGAALMGFSYRGIRGGVDAIVRKTTGRGEAHSEATVPTGRVAWALVKFIVRYGVIAIAAWIALVPLKAHPLGLFAGVSVPVLAIAIEALRLIGRPPGTRRADPRDHNGD